MLYSANVAAILITAAVLTTTAEEPTLEVTTTIVLNKDEVYVVGDPPLVDKQLYGEPHTYQAYEPEAVVAKQRHRSKSKYFPSASEIEVMETNKILLSERGGADGCFEHVDSTAVGTMIAAMPPADAFRAFGVYRICKRCSDVCSRAFNPTFLSDDPLCLTDIQGCTAPVISCSLEDTDYICHYSRGCGCKFKPNAHNPRKDHNSGQLSNNPFIHSYINKDAKKKPKTLIPMIPRAGDDGRNRVYNKQLQDTWIYENRVTISLLTVWFLCAAVYIGYNYRCVSQTCFGWMPCCRGCRSDHQENGMDSDSVDSDSLEATPPRARRAREVNFDVMMTTASLPKYEDVVSAEAMEMDGSPPSYQLFFGKISHVRARLGVWKKSLPLKNAYEQVIEVEGYKTIDVEDTGDVVLLMLKRAPQQSDAVIPACLSQHPAIPRTGQPLKCYLSGWYGGELKFVPVDATPCRTETLCLDYGSALDNMPCMVFWGGTLNCFIKPHGKPGKWEILAAPSVTGTCNSQELPDSTRMLASVFTKIRSIVFNPGAIESFKNPPCNGEYLGFGACIAPHEHFDGVLNSPDLKDEYGNPGKDISLCEMTGTGCVCNASLESQYLCGSGECIPEAQRCSEYGTKNCYDGSDKKQCDCVADVRTGKVPGKLCDANFDCPEGADESPSLCGVPPNGFRCYNSSDNKEGKSPYVPVTQLCDGTKDCPSGEDEDYKNCICMSEDSYVPIDALWRPRKSREGNVFVRKNGIWTPVCADKWKPLYSDTVCRVWGYSKAVSTKEVTFSYVNPRFAMEYYVGMKVKNQPYCLSLYLKCA